MRGQESGLRNQETKWEVGYGVRDTSIRAGFTSSVILEGVQNLEVSAESLVDRNQKSGISGFRT